MLLCGQEMEEEMCVSNMQPQGSTGETLRIVMFTLQGVHDYGNSPELQPECNLSTKETRFGTSILQLNTSLPRLVHQSGHVDFLRLYPIRVPRLGFYGAISANGVRSPSASAAIHFITECFSGNTDVFDLLSQDNGIVSWRHFRGKFPGSP